MKLPPRPVDGGPRPERGRDELAWPAWRPLWATLRRDHVFWLFFGVFGLLQLPYVLPGLSDAQIELFGDRYASLILMPMLVVVFLGRSGVRRSAAELDLWRLIALAYFFWGFQEWMGFVVSETTRASVAFGLLSDALFGLYYLCWFLAAGAAPHIASDDWADRWIRTVRSAGTGVLVWGFVAYLSVAPARAVAENDFLAWVPSLYLYVVLDALLTIRFVTMMRTAGPRWRLLYGLLAAFTAGTVVLDLAEALIYQEILGWTDPRVSILWNLPFVPLVIAGRLRFHGESTDDLTQRSHGLPRLAERSPLVTLAFAFPVLHFSFGQLQLGDPAVHAARESMTLFFMLLLAGFAAIEHVLLHQLQQRADHTRRELIALREAKLVAERSDHEKTQFLANVSHEVRTPMNGILGMVGLLLEQPLANDSRHHAETLEASARGLLEIFDDILDYSNIEDGALRLQPTSVSIVRTGHQVTDLLGPSAESQEVTLTFEARSGLPESIACDGSRLRQVLLNLLSNALKFTPAGGRVDLVASAYEDDKRRQRGERGTRVRFVVRDTGIGMSEEALRRIFEPFTQADESTVQRFGGSGLGLAISKKIVEAMGGEIQASSQPGAGATFSFTLPARQATAGLATSHREVHGADADAATSDDGSHRPPKPQREHGNRHVLVVEDNAVNQMITLHLLEALGYTADLASNGFEALDAMERSEFALVLMDCQMPDMDGYEATRRWRRSEPADRHLPIIAITAHAFERDRQRCLAAGMDDFLAKPFDASDLEEILSRW